MQEHYDISHQYMQIVSVHVHKQMATGEIIDRYLYKLIEMTLVMKMTI